MNIVSTNVQLKAVSRQNRIGLAGVYWDDEQNYFSSEEFGGNLYLGSLEEKLRGKQKTAEEHHQPSSDEALRAKAAFVSLCDRPGLPQGTGRALQAYKHMGLRISWSITPSFTCVMLNNNNKNTHCAGLKL